MACTVPRNRFAGRSRYLLLKKLFIVAKSKSEYHTCPYKCCFSRPLIFFSSGSSVGWIFLLTFFSFLLFNIFLYLRVFYIMSFFYTRVATLIISIPLCVYSHTHLSLWVCSYTHSKILQRDIYEKFQKQPYFLNVLWLYLITTIWK